MRIAIDYTPAITQGAGIGRYTRNLVAALAAYDTEDHFTLFSSESPTPERPIPTGSNITPRIVPLGSRNLTILWQRLRVPLPIQVFTGRADVLHGPDFVLPPSLGSRRVVTVHDLAFLTHPECALPSLAEYLKRAVPRTVARADIVIADSQRTADDLVERLSVPRERIRVIYLGIDPTFTPDRDEAALAAVRARYGIERPCVLAVSTIEPRKNYERLIAAFAQATRLPDGPRMLLIAGRKGWLYEGVFRAVETHGVSDRVTFLNYVPDADLPLLYQAADVLAMPSIYEGFGIPVVEAMASGTPVVCSNGGSLAEIAGDAALIVAPEDVEGLRDALVRAVAEPTLRTELIARGLARVRGFTWEAAARAHRDVYHAAYDAR